MQNMTCMKTHVALLLLPLFFLPLQAGEDGVWHTDFETAKQWASREKKDLLIYFTGSDWCGWCMKLEKEVFADTEFNKEISKGYILVKIDFPRRKELTPWQSQHNAALKKQYTVLTYPTVMLCDALGRPYARTRYKEGGAKRYLSHLAELKDHKKDRDAALALAKTLEGQNKARTLEKALASVPRLALSFYERELATIHAADPDDISGFYSRYQNQKTATELGYIAKPYIARGNHADLISEIENYISSNKLQGETRQTALIFKLTTQYSAKNHAAALKSADEIIAINNLNNQGRYAAMVKKRILRRQGKR